MRFSETQDIEKVIFPLNALDYKLISVEQHPDTPVECNSNNVGWIYSNEIALDNYSYLIKQSISSLKIDLNSIGNKQDLEGVQNIEFFRVALMIDSPTIKITDLTFDLWFCSLTAINEESSVNLSYDTCDLDLQNYQFTISDKYQMSDENCGDIVYDVSANIGDF